MQTNNIQAILDSENAREHQISHIRRTREQKNNLQTKKTITGQL